MLQSKLFSKTQKYFPKDEELASAKYLIRAGYIRKSSAGIYTYLPLAWRVLNKINQIIREEMNAIGGEELLMPALVAKKYWVESGRWDVPIVYKIKTPQKDEFGLGWTHEEVIAHIAKDFIQSEKDLPKAVYQIQNKFRLEPRARGGLIRGREFMMKDLYSFHKDRADLERYYKKAEGAYKKVFKRMSLPIKVVEAAGGDFTKEYTHEFQVPVDSGEDTIFHCAKCAFAQNKEVTKAKAGDKCPQCKGKIQESRAIEVGNIFRLGKRYSQWMMGSYGIGISRALAALVEIHHDDRGIIWPEAVAPYQVHLLELGEASARGVYQKLQKNNIETLYDDRDVSAGEKFADADLLGIPWRLVVSKKTGNKIEIKKRNSNKTKLLKLDEVIQSFCKKHRYRSGYG
ncbi:MAG: aminoacyl--tRNA ligase-related protein [Patescibacteria group bacterium]